MTRRWQRGRDGVGRPSDPDIGDVRAAQRDRAAFAALYRRYLDRVYGYAFYLLGDHHDAEDATERTFLAALDAIDAYRDEGAGFRAWLFRDRPQPACATRSARAAGTGRRHSTPCRSRWRRATTRRAGRAMPRRAARGSARRRDAADRPPPGRSCCASSTASRRRRSARCWIGAQGAVRVLQHRALRDLAAPRAGGVTALRGPVCNVSGSAVLAGA